MEYESSGRPRRAQEEIARQREERRRAEEWLHRNDNPDPGPLGPFNAVLVSVTISTSVAATPGHVNIVAVVRITEGSHRGHTFKHPQFNVRANEVPPAGRHVTAERTYYGVWMWVEAGNISDPPGLPVSPSGCLMALVGIIGLFTTLLALLH